MFYESCGYINLEVLHSRYFFCSFCSCSCSLSPNFSLLAWWQRLTKISPRHTLVADSHQILCLSGVLHREREVTPSDSNTLVSMPRTQHNDCFTNSFPLLKSNTVDLSIRIFEVITTMGTRFHVQTLDYHWSHWSCERVGQ